MKIIIDDALIENYKLGERELRENNMSDWWGIEGKLHVIWSQLLMMHKGKVQVRWRQDDALTDNYWTAEDNYW